MIEVEKKFILTPENERRLLDGAEFVSERMFTDVYYDSDDYALTTNDIWLRARDSRWELKVSLRTDPHRSGDQYEEIEDEARIREKLDMPAGENLESDLALAGYAPFCIVTTLRRKYKKGPFTIDLDEGRWDGATARSGGADDGAIATEDAGARSGTADDRREDGSHTLTEIELMVHDASEVEKALQDIHAFAEQNGLALERVHGKAVMCLKGSRPQHFRALVEAGVVRDY